MKKTIIYIIAIITLLVTASTLSYGWDTFILRLFNLPKINMWTTTGLILMYELVVWKYEDTSGRTDDEWLKRALAGLSIALTTWGMLFIISIF